MSAIRIVLALAAVALIVVGIVVTQTLDRAKSPAIADVLGVDEVAKNPAAFADQEVRLTGVVSAVVPDEQLFAVIDQAEYADCKVVTCSQYQIPITYAGELPAVEASVTVTGHLTQPESGRYLFQASALELLE